jgi:hypothetical protein
MYRITTVGSLPLGLSSRLLAQRFVTLLACLLAVFTMALYSGVPLHAQSTSGGGITGTVTDPQGKVVIKAKVTATNTDTGVAANSVTTSEGLYSFNDLSVGTYNVEVVATGFQRLLQENVNVDNASMFGLNMKLTVGGDTQTITVTDAPPYLDTTDSTLGGTIENELYTALPLSMQGGARDPTAFQYLMPGVQENPDNATNQGSTAGASGIYGGSGQTGLNQNYVEGIPVSNISAQGSGTQVATAVSVDAVNQFSVQTSGASVSFGGAGSANYTINSGGNTLHGTAYDFIRNTIFDTWGYVKQPVTSTGIETKPAEHQNEFGGTVQGPIIKDKLFFFVSYDGFRFTKISNTPQLINVPTMLNRQGNFTDLHGSTNAAINDPTTTFGSAGRPPWQGLLNGVPTYNVIPPAEFSSVSLGLQAALPAPTSSATSNNYLASLPLANSNYNFDIKIDAKINSRNSFSLTTLGGNVGYGGAPNYGNYTQLPAPYASGSFTNQKTASGLLSYVYVASQTLINSLKYGFTRNWGEGFPITAGKSMPNALPAVAALLGANPAIPDTMPSVPGCNGGENTCAVGITNTPPGNATTNMPSVGFSGGTAPGNWAASNSTGPVATNAYTALDNLNWVKNRHNIIFGIQLQWLQTNAGGNGYGGFSNSLALTYNSLDSGEPYASFLVGAVYGYSGNTQAIQDIGARYRPISPYIQDNWQVSPKLTLNLGFRYDYLQPYHEVKDRISFINTTKMNPIVGIPGVVEFAGFPDVSQFSGSTNPPETPAQQLAMYAPYICHCTTPVHPFNQNWQPRVGFAYAINATTVIRGNFGLSVTHAGGVGGGSRATNGTGNSGEFSSSYGQSQGNSSTPNAIYLTTYFAPNATPNSSLTTPTNGQGTQGTSPIVTICPNNVSVVAPGSCNPWTSIPPWTVPGQSVNPLNTTGNYDYTKYNADHLNDFNCGGTQYCNPGSGLVYADPYYGGRGPQFITFSFGLQKQINKKAVFSADYSGTETHFLPGGSGRGYAQNTFSPDYDQSFGTNTVSAGYFCSFGAPGSTGYAAACPNGNQPPFPLFAGTGATVQASLRPFPQFGGFTDAWGNTGNSNYDSLQLQVQQRPWHNLSGLINYTRAKQIDDTGHRRSQFPVTNIDGNFPTPLSANRLDRGIGGNSQTNAFNVAWVYTLPFGRGQAFFATNRIAGMIGEGWEFSGTYQYRDGYPLAVTNTSGQCEPNTYGGQGPDCFPDYNPTFDKRKARINGRWGRGPGSNESSFGSIQYLDPNAFECPDSPSTNIYRTCNEDENTGPLSSSGPLTQSYKLGNIARNAPDGLHGPGWWNINLGMRRTFMLRETATLHLSFQLEADVTNTTNSTFFNVGSAAGWDNSNYGEMSGQNQQAPPRDWQFAGRFRF